MRKNTSFVFRLSGIIFFVITMLSILNVFDVMLASFTFAVSPESTRLWSIYYIFSALVYSSSFIFATLSTGTAALFAGKNNYTQSVWNLAVYSLVTLSLYSSLEIITGIENKDDLFFLVQSIVQVAFFMIIIYFCLKENDDFSWKDILPHDENTKQSLKVSLLMLVLIIGISIILSHKI